MNVLVRSVLSVLLVACSRQAGGGSTGPSAGGANAVAAANTLGDLLPIAIRLDCSKLAGASPPSTAYLQITEPVSKKPTLSARVDGDLCADHDVAHDPDAAALGIGCPPRQLPQFDSYPTPCLHHDIAVAVCSPGFEEQHFRLQDLTTCPTAERARPSCDGLGRGDASAYPYEQVVYQPVPRADGGTDCPSFAEPPPSLLSDEPLYDCPCAGAPSTLEP